MHCGIWYYSHNLEKREKQQMGKCYFIKGTWVFFTFFKLSKWYKIAPSITYLWITDPFLKISSRQSILAVNFEKTLLIGPGVFIHLF